MKNGRNSRRRPTRAVADQDQSPDLYFSATNNARRDHKTAQLCRQIFRALSLAFPECADDLLRDLTVHDVQPAPDASRVLVRVALSPMIAPVGLAEILARLGDATPFLRREVTAAITRKRAPELMFVLVPPTAEAHP